MNEKLFKKILDHAIKLYYKAKQDELLYGNTYIEFGDRSLNILDPIKMDHSIKINPNGDVYGKSPIESMINNMNIKDFCKKILNVKISDYQEEFIKKLCNKQKGL